MTRLRSPRHGLAALAIAGALALGGCDPCAGVVECRTGPRVSYTGRVIDYEVGRGVGDVAVVFRRTGGAELVADSLVARTDAEGRFRLVGDLRGGGEVVGVVTVRPPAPRPAHAIAGVRMTSSDVRGGGGVFDVWAAQPYVAWVASVVSRRNVSTAWAHATFRRTGGARLAGGDSLRTSADPNGYFLLEALALDTGEVVGTLEVESLVFARSYTIENVRIPVRVVDRRPQLDRVVRIGSSLEYVLELKYRGSWTPVAGADVVFRRTGGLRLEVDTVRGIANAEGRVRLAPVPATEAVGEVIGDVTVRASGLPRPFVVRGVRLQTFDFDELRFAGVYGVGYAAQVAGELVYRGDRSPIANAQVRFVRTGGLTTSTPTVETRARADGWFGVGVPTDTSGEVSGTLVVQPPGATAPTTFANVRLPASGDDSVRYAGRFAVGPWFGFAGMLVNRGNGTPAVGWRVRFTRTGGVALVAESSTFDVLDWGGFSLQPPTRVAGAVEGTLTALAPNGGREVPLGSVRLTTTESDSVVLFGRWAVGPSLLYVGELRRDDTGAPVVGARAEFRRTGGIPTVEAVVGEPSNQFGRFRMAPTPLAAGEVVGDLYVFPPAPLRDTVFRDVRLTTFETDETRLHAVWRLAGPR